MSITRVLAAAVCAFTLAGCGDGGSDSSTLPPPAPTPNASPGGIWRGTESSSGLSVVGLVDETGRFHFIRSDNVQYVGAASTSGNSISANFEGFVQFGSQFVDGSTHGTGSVSGTITERSQMSLSTTFQTDAGGMTSGTLDLTFDQNYDQASSLATISGNYTDGSDTVTVSSNGAIFEQDPVTGCVVNGTVSLINATYNAYEIAYSFASCIGQYSVLNGLQFTGLGTLDTSQSPEHAIIGVTATSGSTKLAIVYDLPHE